MAVNTNTALTNRPKTKHGCAQRVAKKQTIPVLRTYLKNVFGHYFLVEYKQISKDEVLEEAMHLRNICRPSP